MSAASSSQESSALDVLFVCTANVCRSPAAERLLRHELEERSLSWRVGSAGTQALIGAPIHPEIRALLVERHVPLGRSEGQQLTEAMVERSTVVLAATRTHRSVVVDLVPSAIRRTFTIRQFARLCVAGLAARTTGPATDVDALLRIARAGRRSLQPVSARHDAIEDPIGQPAEGYRACVEVIQQSVERMLRPLVGGS